MMEKDPVRVAPEQGSPIHRKEHIRAWLHHMIRIRMLLPHPMLIYVRHRYRATKIHFACVVAQVLVSQRGGCTEMYHDTTQLIQVHATDQYWPWRYAM